MAAPQGDTTAEALNAFNIGQVISFNHLFGSGVKARITGELRQIYHIGGQTVLDLAAPERDEHGGELEQFVVLPGLLITYENA